MDLRMAYAAQRHEIPGMVMAAVPPRTDVMDIGRFGSARDALMPPCDKDGLAYGVPMACVIDRGREVASCAGCLPALLQLANDPIYDFLLLAQTCGVPAWIILPLIEDDVSIQHRSDFLLPCAPRLRKLERHIRPFGHGSHRDKEFLHNLPIRSYRI